MSFPLIPTTLSLILSLAFGASAALAAPHASINGIVKEAARESGRSEDDVRREAIDLLHTDGRFSDADLERIGRGEERGIEKSVRDSMLERLGTEKRFEAAEGALLALAAGARNSDAANAFTAMKSKEVELPAALQASCVDTILGPKQVGISARANVSFELQVSVAVLPPYAESYVMTLKIDGKTLDIDAKDLLTPTAQEILKKVHRTNGALVVRGHMNAMRVKRDFPPYGMSRFLDLTIE